MTKKRRPVCDPRAQDSRASPLCSSRNFTISPAEFPGHLAAILVEPRRNISWSRVVLRGDVRRPASELQGITVVHLGGCHDLVEINIFLRPPFVRSIAPSTIEVLKREESRDKAKKTTRYRESTETFPQIRALTTRFCARRSDAIRGAGGLRGLVEILYLTVPLRRSLVNSFRRIAANNSFVRSVAGFSRRRR